MMQLLKMQTDLKLLDYPLSAASSRVVALLVLQAVQAKSRWSSLDHEGLPILLRFKKSKKHGPKNPNELCDSI